MVGSSGISLCTNSRGYGAAPRIQKLVPLLCGSIIGSYNVEHKASSDTLNLKMNYYFPLVSVLLPFKDFDIILRLSSKNIIALKFRII